MKSKEDYVIQTKKRIKLLLFICHPEKDLAHQTKNIPQKLSPRNISHQVSRKDVKISKQQITVECDYYFELHNSKPGDLE